MSRKLLVIIPARGGSKGIPRKNLRTLNNKPLIYFSIKNALSLGSNYEIDCYVSSDDPEILLIATKFGAKTLMRDKNIANDKATLDPVIFDAYNKVREIENKEYDLVITLQPTSPLLQPESIEMAIEQLSGNRLETIISGINDSHLTWLKSGDDYIPNYQKRLNRQELPEVYKETGGFVITKPEFIKENSRFGDKVGIFPLSKKEAIDIDDFDDWSLCEFYLKQKTILFVVIGNSKIGMGHVYNTLSVANEILNHRLVFLVCKDNELAYQKISESNYQVHAQEGNTIIEDIDRIAPDVIVNDILDTASDYVIDLKSKGYKVINFEDLGEGSKHADIVINAMYPENKIILNHYYGAKYFILRDEFLYTPKKQISQSVKTILLSFGGVDPNDFTRRVLKVISPYCKNNDINIKVVTGLGYKDVDSLKKEYSNCEIKNNINNISHEFSTADLVFTSAGRTTFEVASIGVPCIVLCQNVRETTHFFASEKNGFYNLGLGAEISDEQIMEAMIQVLDFDLRQLMNKRMLNNGLKEGKKRVLKLIKSTL